MPIQAVAARGVAGTVEVFPRYEEGVRDAPPPHRYMRATKHPHGLVIE